MGSFGQGPDRRIRWGLIGSPSPRVPVVYIPMAVDLCRWLYIFVLCHFALNTHQCGSEEKRRCIFLNFCPR